MVQLDLTTFSPSTVIASAEVNANFLAIQAAINALRPTLYIPRTGTLVVETNFYPEITMQQTLTFVEVGLRAKTAPTGADVIVDILKNGSSIFTTKPRIIAGATTGGSSAVFGGGADPGVVDGDVLTFNIDQIGSTVAGADLTISLVMRF